MAIPTTANLALSLRLSKALSLAKAGHTREAEDLLSPDGRIPDDPVLLHALASLVTSGEDYPRAIHLWHLLLQKEPGHPEALRMIEYIDVWTSRPVWFRYIPAGAAVLGTMLIGILILSASASKPAPAKQAVQPSPVRQPAPANVYQPQPYTPAAAPARTSLPEPTINLTFPPPKPAKKR